MERLRNLGRRSPVAETNRVQIDGRWYNVCTACREPLTQGYDSPKPDGSEQAALRGVLVERGVLCGPDFVKEYAEVSPEAAPPVVADGLLVKRS